MASKTDGANLKRVANAKDEDLQLLDKADLIARVKQLEAHVKQLKDILAKQMGEAKHYKQKKGRHFDFDRCNKRHVALKICYLGWDYQGLAAQEDTVKTVEAELFSALLKTCLIKSRETSNYHRCGRTDKGVSAFGQVISIDLRSNASSGRGVINVVDDQIIAESEADELKEISYVGILNKVLPPEIRVLAWAPVALDFSARFNCIRRSYKYYFPRGDLNIAVMQEACRHFIGEHDFRNFCKMDVGNGVTNYVRQISEVTIQPVTSKRFEDSTGDFNGGKEGYRLVELTVVGQAFLWHQIRCMVAILFLVGQGLENPDIVSKLLDVKQYPRKPQYNIALDLPLVLFECEYEDVEWVYDEGDVHKFMTTGPLFNVGPLAKNVELSGNKVSQSFWHHCECPQRCEIIWQMLANLENQRIKSSPLLSEVKSQLMALVPRSCKTYKPLLERPQCVRVPTNPMRTKADAWEMMVVFQPINDPLIDGHTIKAHA